MTLGVHFLVPENAWLMSINARTFVPDKTQRWGAWKQWYVWPYHSSTWQDTALRGLETVVCMTLSKQYLTRHCTEGPGNRGIHVWPITAVPDKTQRWGPWKQWYVWPITIVPNKTQHWGPWKQRYGWPITAVPDKTQHWGASNQRYTCMTKHSSTWQDTALRALKTVVCMTDHNSTWQDTALRALETEVWMTDHSSTWLCGSLAVYWSLSQSRCSWSTLSMD